MTDFDLWVQRHPQAAAELFAMTSDTVPHTLQAPASEARAQQDARMEAGRRKGVLWRNNVGATKTQEQHKCPKCQFVYVENKPPLRYGLCNDSAQLNAKFKSSDLIGIKPVLITPQMVGQTIGQFWAVEVKAPGVPINPNDKHQRGQHAFGALVTRFGGEFEFSYGALK